MSIMSQPGDEPTFAVFWLYKAAPEWRRLEPSERAYLCGQFVQTLAERSGQLTLRGAYSLVGLRPDADLLLWLHGPSLDEAHELAVALRKTGLGTYLDAVYTYTGVVPASRYNPQHRPAFVQGKEPRAYVSMYPFTKTPEWHLLPFERRRALMAEHGKMGAAHSAISEAPISSHMHGDASAGTSGGTAVAVAEAVATEEEAAPRGGVLANTVHAFGLGDYEFVVAFESDDPVAIERMVEDLRAAEVRRYTAVDIPIFLGRRKSLDAALDDLG